IVDNHMSGVGAMRALLDAGIKIGEPMSIIVWGKMEDSLAGYNVTTIDQPHPDRAGAKMIEMLLALQAGTPPEQLQVLWQPVLIPGETVGQVKLS
ncbi:MAG: LacI family transcriptional regulator, partial [Burkholderiaceae bacterium]